MLHVLHFIAVDLLRHLILVEWFSGEEVLGGPSVLVRFEWLFQIQSDLIASSSDNL